MLLTAALLVLSCDIRGTETSSEGVLQNNLTMRYRFDEAHRQVDFSNNGGPWRSYTGAVWKVASWDEDRVVLRADKGTATFDLKALTMDNHVVEHRNGLAIDQVGHAVCQKM
jgi:uncharacterized protein YegJ (DUF2314 family)